MSQKKGVSKKATALNTGALKKQMEKLFDVITRLNMDISYAYSEVNGRLKLVEDILRRAHLPEESNTHPLLREVRRGK